MSCDPKSFHNITRPVFDGLKAKLESAGYEVPGTSGIINGPMSISIAFRWDEASAVLHTHVKNKNFLVPCSRINAELEKAIASVS
jgi:hypothetical protein